MSTPAPALADTAEQHTDQLALLTATVTAQATATLAAALHVAQAAATAAWITTTGDLATTPQPRQLERLLADARARITTAMRDQGLIAQQALRDGARQATAMGGQQAARFATAASGIPAAPPPAPPTGPEVQQVIAHVPEQVGEQHTAALNLLTAATVAAAGWAGVAAAFNVARRAVSRIRAAASWVCGASVAAGVTAFARRYRPETDSGIPAEDRQPTMLVWAAEPGACPACAAYAGRAVHPGEKFPGGITLGPPRTAFPDPITGPPRHNHCRCVLVPWRADWARPGSPFPDLLAQRARAPRP